MMPPAGYGCAWWSTTAPKKTCARCGAGWPATDGRWLYTPIKRDVCHFSPGAAGRAVERSAGPHAVRTGLAELGIEWIAAHSPQAKGRIERFFSTAQDRLVKEMRLAGIDTLEGSESFSGDSFHSGVGAPIRRSAPKRAERAPATATGNNGWSRSSACGRCEGER